MPYQHKLGRRAPRVGELSRSLRRRARSIGPRVGSRVQMASKAPILAQIMSIVDAIWRAPIEAKRTMRAACVEMAIREMARKKGSALMAVS